MKAENITDGDIREQLTEVRDHLVERLPNVSALHVAPIGRLLIDVLVKLDELPDDAKGSKTDDLTKRRQDRQAAARGEKAAGL